MRIALFPFLALGAAWTLAAAGAVRRGSAAERTPVTGTPVLVELFTSEGCSSCPPADALLAKLIESQPFPGAQIIALSEHVDYWDRLGWKDPYSSKLFSERQSGYSEVFRMSGAYTPQMVVDGRSELVGSDAPRAQRAIESAAREPKLAVAIERGRAPSSLRVRVEARRPGAESGRAEVLVAIVENGLQSEVRRGENSGRRLSHAAVVRRLESVGFLPGGAAFEKETAVALDPSWNAANLRAVAFVQEVESRKVLGAAQGAL